MPWTAPALPNDLADWRTWLEYADAWAAGPAPAPTPTAVPAPARRPTDRGRLLRLTSYREPQPGPRWQQLHRAAWPAYRAWYLSGPGERPLLGEARDALVRHMPELVPTWERLVALAGGDPLTARLLTMWRIPGFLAGCTQAVVPGDRPVLVRNYDYDPSLFEGIVASTDWSGRPVIGTSDLLWGLLDGMNGDGLAVSLTWGGRPGISTGFGIPIVVRYLLETCADVAEAVAALRRIPVAQAYNLSLVDTTGGHASVFVAPGEEPAVTQLRTVANHRLDRVEDPGADRITRSRERQLAAGDLLLDGAAAERLGDGFLAPPLHVPGQAGRLGTLYTAVYEPAAGRVTYRWPGRTWVRRFEDAEAMVQVRLPEA